MTSRSWAVILHQLINPKIMRPQKIISYRWNISHQSRTQLKREFNVLIHQATSDSFIFMKCDQLFALYRAIINLLSVTDYTINLYRRIFFRMSLRMSHNDSITSLSMYILNFTLSNNIFFVLTDSHINDAESELLFSCDFTERERT